MTIRIFMAKPSTLFTGILCTREQVEIYFLFGGIGE